MYKITRISLALILLAVIHSAIAGIAAQYQIEMIVYSHFTSKALNSEAWPQLSPIPERDLQHQPIQLTPANGSAAPFTLLSRNYFKLNNEASRIAATAGYKVLLHVAWRQSVLSPSRARAVSISGGPVNSGVNAVSGTVKISVNHYLDAKVNLLLAAPLDEIRQIARTKLFPNQTDDVAYFRLSQNRRMRSDELNYLPHPLYGVLIKIFPIKQLT